MGRVCAEGCREGRVEMGRMVGKWMMGWVVNCGFKAI